MPFGSFVLGLVVGGLAGPVLLFAILGWIVRRRMRKVADAPPWVPTGEVVSLDWEVQTLDGNSINLGKSFAGRVVFLNFWATWCPPCLGEAASIDRLHARLTDRVAFACISQENP